MQVKAAVLHQPNTDLVLETLELEDPRPNELRVRLLATGICHTDLSFMGRPFLADQPMVLGHEGAGIVEAVGEQVSKVKVGDRVLLSYNACGECRHCLRNASTYCDYFIGSNFLGQRRDGSVALSRGGQGVRHNFFGQSSFATHCLCTTQNVVKVPDEVSDEAFMHMGPLGCGLQTGAGAVMNVLRVSAGQSLAVFGSGAVGMAAIMAAKAAGATTIIAVDRVAARLTLAEELGATHSVLVGPDVDTVAAIRAITGDGVNHSLDTTAVPEVLRQAVECLAPLGCCGFVGAGAPGETVALEMRDMMLHGKSLRGIIEGDANPDDFIPLLIRLHQRGLFPLEKMVKFYDFDDIGQAIADADAGLTVKPILRFAGQH